MMRYSYTPQAGLTSAPSASQSSYRPSPSPRPQSQYQTPPNSPQSPPTSQSNYRHQSYSSAGPSPQLRPSYSNTGANPYYTPVDYNEGYDIAPDKYYGSLLNANGYPSEVYSRMADALFFYLDQNYSVPGLRGTGLIEPDKYVWMEMMTGATQEAAQIVEAFLESYYKMANIPYRVVVSQSGEQIPVLDRKAWLHLHVFDAKSDPDQGHKDFSNYIRLFNLKDPLTNQPFPTPLPRSSFPLLADQTLRANVENWKVQAITAIAQARKQAEQAQVNEMIANMTRRPAYSFNPSLASFGAAGMGAGGYTGAYFAQGGANPGGGGENDNHANVMDVISGGLTLTNTILGSMGGGGFGGSSVGAGLLGGMFGAGF